MDQPKHDLWYDATTVGADLIVETWISHGPRATDVTFDPQPGDWVTVGDDEEPTIRGRITRRDDNKLWVQLDLGLVASDAASLRTFDAIVWVGERSGERVAVAAQNPAEATAKLRARFGDDAVITAWNAEDADRPR